MKLNSQEPEILIDDHKKEQAIFIFLNTSDYNIHDIVLYKFFPNL